VRRALKLGKRGKIRYSVQPDGVVLLRREEEAEVMDPVVEKFLAFLGKEMQAHPERIKPIDPKWMRRAQTLVKGVKFDINKPLDPANE
jgi:antitoxin PrlF